MKRDTLAVHGPDEAPRDGPVVEPIHQTSTFAASTTQAIDDVYEGRRAGYVYTRQGNPTVDDAARRLASLEGGEGCVLTASGMAATTLIVLSLVPAGGTIVCNDDLYGGTAALFDQVLPRLGIGVVSVPGDDPASFAREDASLIWVESPTNPRNRICDIEAIAAAGRECGVPVAVDSTLASPVLCRPLELGADIVMHSCTKYLSGHSDLIAGAVVSSASPAARISAMHKLTGAILDPHAAFLLARGMKTVHLRVRRADANARAVASHLASAGRPVLAVHHPSLPSHPDHVLASKQMPDGCGGLLAVDLDGGLSAAGGFVDALRVIRNAASLGGTESLASIPVLQSHRGMDPERRSRLGITEGTVRLALGIEDPDDLIADVERGLDAVRR